MGLLARNSSLTDMDKSVVIGGRRQVGGGGRGYGVINVGGKMQLKNNVALADMAQ